MRPSGSGASASNPPLAGARASAFGVGNGAARPSQAARRRVAPDAVMALEAHQPAAAGQAFQRFGVAPIARDRPALGVEEWRHLALHQVHEAAGLVAHDAGGEPVAAVADGAEAAAGRDAQPRQPAEGALAAPEIEPAEEFQAADPARGGVRRIEGDLSGRERDGRTEGGAAGQRQPRHDGGGDNAARQ